MPRFDVKLSLSSLAASLPLLLAGLALLSGGLATAGAQPQEGPPAIPEEALERARTAGKALGSDLMGQLMEELAKGGPAEALKVCSEVAQDVAASYSGDGLWIRRVSLKVRNPADRPDPWEEEQLERLETLNRDGKLPPEVAAVVREGGQPMLRWLKPIVVAEACLQCHGDPESFDPKVRRVLAERHPDDEATGYQVGDLRGAVSVKIVLEGTASW